MNRGPGARRGVISLSERSPQISSPRPFSAIFSFTITLNLCHNPVQRGLLLDEEAEADGKVNCPKSLT